MLFAELEAVTVDAFGTLLELENPVPRLERALERRGVLRSRAEIAEAFAAVALYSRPRAAGGRDPESLAELRRECVAVFLDQLGAPIEPETFTEPFLDALVFRPVEGAVAVLEELRVRGIRLAVAANWDCSLPETLVRAGLARCFSAVATSAEAGRAKPDPAVLRLALDRLGIEPAHALHVGDEPADAQAAAAAGMQFHYAPLAAAVEGLE